jgi:hypothetical protein
MMAPKLHATGPLADTHDAREEQSSRKSTRDSTPPPDALSLVLEQMAIINARLDAHATATAAPRQLDALRDAPLV